MDKKTTKLLIKKAKKLSKWTEGVFVNPIYWKTNGTVYYMAGFTLKKRVVGTAYLTIGDEKKEEAMEAQKWLSLFSDISSNILKAGNDRLRIKSAYFIKPLNIAAVNAGRQVDEGREAYAQLWEIQQKYADLAKEYLHYYNEDVLVRGLLTESDIRYTQEQANLATMLQYRTLKVLVDCNEELRAFAEYIKNSTDYGKLTRDEKDFLKGITGNKEQLRKNLEALNLIIDENPEKMTKLNLEKHRKMNEEQVAAQQQYVRYPK